MISPGHATQWPAPVVRGDGPAASSRGTVTQSDGADAELVELFDRYLAVFADATRRLGTLFPYNQLRLRIQAMLAGRTARILVRDSAGVAVASFDVRWQGGEFHRVAAAADPAFSWSLDVQTLEDAAVAPWAYLAHPKRLGLAWFSAQ